MFCPFCGVKHQMPGHACTACGKALPDDRPRPAPAPAPAEAPRILKPKTPTPLRPRSLDVVPSAARAPQPAPNEVTLPPVPARETPAEVTMKGVETPRTRPQPLHAREDTDRMPRARSGRMPPPAPPPTLVPQAVQPAVVELRPGIRVRAVGGGRAMGAALFDALVAWGPGLVVGALSFVAHTAPAKREAPLQVLLALVAAPLPVWVALVVAMAMGALQSALFARRLGASIGGLLVGAELVRIRDGARVSALRGALDGALFVVSSVTLIVPLYAFWVDGFYRGLGGLVARTLLVRRRRASKREAHHAR